MVGIGELLWDVFGENRTLGGAPANFAYHVHRFGLPSIVVSAVGHDSLGDESIAILRDKGLQTLITRDSHPTGQVIVRTDSAGIPQYHIEENTAWDHIPFTNRMQQLAAQTRAVCFGSLAQRSEVSRSTITAFLDAIPHNEERLIVFDANLRQHYYTPELLKDSIRRCNILKINDEEIDIVAAAAGADGADIAGKAQSILTLHQLQAVIVTCGTKGSLIQTASESSWLDTPKVEVVDTVGAGDSFTGAFVAALLQGRTLRQAHELAVETAAITCAKRGAMW